MPTEFPQIPHKRYFTIGEVSRLCRVQQHVLRYWEQEFPELKPIRSGNRRRYQRHDVYLIRQISDLLRRQRYTIDGARRQLKYGDAKEERIYSRQLLKELRTELEAVLAVLKV